MFTDRAQAGQKLAKKLEQYQGTDAIVLALPRGGVVVGYELARALRLPLDIIAVRKIGHPMSPEYAIGAVDENGTTILNEAETKLIDQSWLTSEIEREKKEAKRRSATYRAGRLPLPPAGKTAMLVDDGIATGLTMRLAVRSAKKQGAAKVIVAVPIAPAEAIRMLKAEGADDVIVVEPPEEFAGAIGAHYTQFEQVEDVEVIGLLQPVRKSSGDMRVKVGKITLDAMFSVPVDAKGVVIFAHGSGSSRFSPRNVFVAHQLQKAGIGTLLIDLLTKKEDEVYETRFDIDLLTERLGRVVRWIGQQPATKDLAVGLFGASTGTASALNVAARLGKKIAAVVSRGGRPDLAIENLGKVEAPTLLIVGGNDFGVIELNEKALRALRCERKLEIVPGATHLFEESGALEKVAARASEWFANYFVSRTKVESAEEEVEIPPKLRNSADTPTRPPGKIRAAAKEEYRHFHRK